LGFPITAGTIRGFTFTAGVPKEAVTTMEQALEKVHNSAAWKDLAKRAVFQDIFMGSAEFTKFLAVRMEEYRVFYDAIGLGKIKAVAAGASTHERTIDGRQKARRKPGFFLPGATPHALERIQPSRPIGLKSNTGGEPSAATVAEPDIACRKGCGRRPVQQSTMVYA
jgi:hypothetical protein